MKISAVAILSVACAAVLSACGGGGGSGGESHAPYQITLRAERTQLPINIDNAGPGIGVSAPYTTTLYVQATENGNPIPGAEDGAFACNTSYGLSSGPLYYLDGKDEHMHDVTLPDGSTVKVPSAYRSITLGSNAGGGSFHFHAGDQAGTATITCSVFDPRDKKNVSTSISITVGASTGKPASVRGVAATPVLGTQGNPNNVSTSTAVQAQVFDDANQPVDGANVQVEIVGGSASSGARLLAGTQSGGVVQIGTTVGVGLFSLSSGTSEGAILLRLTTDRADGNVANGILDPITQLLVIPVSNRTSVATPPKVDATTLPDAPYGLPYAFALSATGGAAPYTWSASGGLPTGMSLSADGLLSGTPGGSQGGKFNFVVRVTDSQGQSATANVSLTVGAPPVVEPVVPPLAIGGCSGATCTLPDATHNTTYSYAFWSTGGTGTTAATWSFVGAIPPIAVATITSAGVLTWNVPLACPVPPQLEFTLQATRGSESVIKPVTIPCS